MCCVLCTGTLLFRWKETGAGDAESRFSICLLLNVAVSMEGDGSRGCGEQVFDLFIAERCCFDGRRREQGMRRAGFRFVYC